MAEYLILTDPNGTNRTVMKSKRMLEYLHSHNATNGQENTIKIGQTFPSEEEANAYVAANPVDNSHSTNPRETMYKTLATEQQSEIDRLKALLAEAEAAKASPEQSAAPSLLNVPKTLELLKTLTSKEEIENILVGETRTTIINAAKLRLTEI